MKLIATTLTTIALAVLASASFAAETNSPRPGRPAGGKDKPEKPAIADVVAHLSATYSQVAPSDLNVNGRLEESEQAQLAESIMAGTVEIAPPLGRTPPVDKIPTSERIAAHAADMYAKVAVYDANKDGVLSADEQAGLKTGIESGKFQRPAHGPKGPQGGPGREGGGRGGPGGRGGLGGGAAE